MAQVGRLLGLFGPGLLAFDELSDDCHDGVADGDDLCFMLDVPR
jgi:hypothetical protein